MGRDDKQYYLGDKNLPTGNTKQEYTPQMIKEMLACAKDIVKFTKHFYITTLEHGKQKIKLYAPQKRIIKGLVKNRFNIILASRQIGKALDINTPVMTPNGWTTMGNIKDGDIVYDNNGKETNVIKAWDIMENRPCYKITFDNGEEIIADEEHLWMTETFNDRRNRRNKTSKKKKTTKEIFDTLYYKNGKSLQPNHAIKLSRPIIGNNIKLPIHPYILGLWLGDGNRCNPTITVSKQDIEDIEQIINYIGFERGTSYNIYDRPEEGNVVSLNLIGEYNGNTMRKSIRDLDLYQNKHIPPMYLRASIEDRKLLLQGLMDSDGSITNTMNTFYNSDVGLIKDVRELLASLGIKYNVKDIVNENYYDEIKGKDMYRLHFKSKFYVFNLQRKRDKQSISNQKKNDYIYIRSVEPVDSVPVRCITVDSPDAVFLCGLSNIVSSNTTLMTIYALWIACFQNDKTILIVANKEDTAKEILARIKMAYEQLPNWLKPGVEEWAKTEVKFSNDSRIRISTTSSSAARGLSINCVDGDSVVTLRDKKSGEVFDITMKDLHEILERDGELLPVTLVDG